MGPSNSAQAIDSPADSSPTDFTLEGQQVLLVEDCADQRRLFLQFLQSAGAEVTLECNGRSAVDAVKKLPTRFDAVVMDFQMPETDGLDATRQLRELGYRGAIIAVTAYGSNELKQSWFQAGCDEYLEKPLDKQKLVGAVRRLVAAAKEVSGA